MKSFEYNANPSRVVFGSGTIEQLPQEVARLSIRRPLVLCTPGQSAHAARLEQLLSGHAAIACAGQFNRAAMHTPLHVTAEALEVIAQRNVDGVVAVGGGSAVGLSKAIALQTDLPQIVVPTTYAGSEMTPVLGQTENGVKTTRSTPRVLPEAVIYDVDLTLSLPPAVSATSGVNAIAHAVEALYAQRGNPIVDMMAEEGIRALARALPAVVADPADRAARSDALYGAWLCSTCLGAVGMCLHHKLCHVLGGTFGLPHADTHTIVLPHALAYNAPHVPSDAMSRIARALGGGGDAVQGLNALLAELKVTRGLGELGMPEEGIDTAADLAVKSPYWNPRPIEREGIREVIRRAWAGEPAVANI